MIWHHLCIFCNRMRVFITIICLLGGMLQAEGRGHTAVSLRSKSNLSLHVKENSDSTSEFVHGSIKGIHKTQNNDPFLSPGIDIGTSKICQFSNKYFVAMKPDARVYDKVVWDLGEPSNVDNIQVINNDNSGNDLWMNSRNINYATIGAKTISLTFYPRGASPVTFSSPILVYPRPAPPVPVPANFCLGATATPLDAVKTEPTLVWYIANPAGGFSIYNNTSGPLSPIPSTASIGKTEYQVTQVSSDGCESVRVSLWVEILSAPTAAPSANNPVYCQDEIAVPLSVTSTLPASTKAVWYDIPNPSAGYAPLTTAPTPGTSAADVPGKDFYVRVESTIGCGESPMTTITVKVNPKPTAPVVPSLTACQNGIVNLTATIPPPPSAAQIPEFWGTNATGGTPSTPTMPSTASSGTQTFYVGYRDANTGCRSNRTPITLTVFPLPDATISGSTTICQNDAAPLTLRASGGLPPNYTFTYEETGSAAGQISVPADASGQFVINNISTSSSGAKTIRLLSVTDGRCNTPYTTKSAIVTIKPNPSASLTLNTPTVCEGDAAPQLTFTGSGGVGTYTFTYAVSNMTGDQNISSGTGGIAVLSVNTSTPITARTYELKRVSYTDGVTCSTPYTGITHSVTIHPKPTIGVAIDGALDPNPRYCQSSIAPTLRFTAPTGSAPFTFTYTTQTGSGAPVTSTADPLATPTMSIPTSTPGITRYTPISIKDANGCVRNLSGVVTVEILPTPSATISASTSAVCQNDPVAPSVIFTGSIGSSSYSPAYSFEYDINGVNKTPITSATGNNTKTETLQTSTVGTFAYTLKKVSYTIGTTTCSFDPVSSSATIKVNPLPTATLTGPSASILICKDGSRPALTFDGDIGRPPYTFDFTRNGLAQTVSGSPSYTERVSTNVVGNIKYQLTRVTDANGCRQAATGTVDIEVAPIPTVNAGPDVWIMSGQKAVLKATAGNANGLLFAWSPASLVDDPGRLQPAASPLSTTRFTLTVTSDKGCENADDVLVTVLLRPEIPNTFTPNGDGANDRWEIPNLSSYPNAIVEVYNTAGQPVFRSTGFYTPWDGTRNGRPLPVGTYYYVINTNFNNEKRSGFITLLR